MDEIRILRREQIQLIWRTINGHSDKVDLAGSEKEWQFFEALLDETPIDKKYRAE